VANLFDKVFSETPSGDEKYTQQEAFAGIALAMAGADRNVDTQEWDAIVTYIRRLRIYDNFSGPAFDKLFDKLFTKLKNEGPGALIAAAKAGLGDDMKLTAFACAVDIALADGVLEDDEKSVITQLAEALEVDDKTAVSIIEVMMIKNKA
jgi:tellurite resistance protein